MENSTQSMSNSELFSKREDLNSGISRVPQTLLMTISDIQQGTTLLSLQLRKLINDENYVPSDREIMAIEQMRHVVRQLTYLQETLRDIYDAWLRADEPEDRYFVFDTDGECQEVSHERYVEVTNDNENLGAI